MFAWYVLNRFNLGFFRGGGDGRIIFRVGYGKGHGDFLVSKGKPVPFSGGGEA